MMEKVLEKHTGVTGTYGTGAGDDESVMEKFEQSAGEIFGNSAKSSDDNLQFNDDNGSDDDAPKKRVKRRIHQFSDSDSDEEQQKNIKSGSEKMSEISLISDAPIFKSTPRISRIRNRNSSESSLDYDSSKSEQAKIKSGYKEKSISPQHSDSDITIFKSIPQKSRIQKVSNESSDSDQAVKNVQQQMRMKNKANQMMNKFKSLKSSRKKDLSAAGDAQNKNLSDSSEESNDEANSIEKIKQKIKERMSFKPSICDPDTSDDENVLQKSIHLQKKEKRTKLISPKPKRMSAKQAMENMQKIKSESNRMLREKEVSLPYHRPKALSLKDIMSRRKPAVSSDGKSLPIKMNEEQLKQYAQMLEDRQKQMMELWQSDTDEENDDKKSDDEKCCTKTADDKNVNNETVPTIIDELSPNTLDDIEKDKEVNADISADNGKVFDLLSKRLVAQTKVSDTKENVSTQEIESTNDNVTEDQDSETNMKLVFNESETSISEETPTETKSVIINEEGIENVEGTYPNIEGSLITENNEHKKSETAKRNTEEDSQLISLHYNTQKADSETLQVNDLLAKEIADVQTENGEKNCNKTDEIDAMEVDAFSDDDMNIEDIDNIIENAEIIRDIEDKVNSQVLIRDIPLNLNPKLTGAPGMVIDLDESNNVPKKSGVELLKERFTFFAKLKTPDELEREKDRRIKPGNQHLKLKQELEEQMAEQRSLEWGKRLEDEKQQQKELKELRGEESDDENDIDKIEAKLEENEAEESTSEEEELPENDIEMKDKPRVKNPMLENEAEVSDCDETEQNDQDEHDTEVNDGDDENDEDNESSDSDSSESEEEQPSTRKGRILKAFEDSDDEEVTEKEIGEKESVPNDDLLGTQPISQDVVLTLAQRHKSASEDLFTSQGSSFLSSQKDTKVITQALPEILENDEDLGTQTFSLMDSTNVPEQLNGSDKLDVICETQPNDVNLDGISLDSQQNLPVTQYSQSQVIGEDILALCTGKFYDNVFISQVDDNNQMPLGASQEYDSCDDDSQRTVDNVQEAKVNDDINKLGDKEENTDKLNNTDFGIVKMNVDDNLKSILDELDDPEFDNPKPNIFFCGAKKKGTEEMQKDKAELQAKKKFVIDSDDEGINDESVSETQKRKNNKKKKPEKRALQISDDEEVSEQEEEYESETEEENEERLVEYDSEENEIELMPQNTKPSKKKRKGTEFFEQEAELTSEDEWVGSGDEDEAGLDRMEREAGDDESFHQGRLQRELGQIHMRDVLDQDKREVRIIQELLFEDGDLGGGGRQRKFKWKNLDGVEDAGTGVNEFGDTQEEEFESEEQWRKQRHERETFLRQMQQNGENNDSLNVSINRNTIIKANLMSKTMSMLLEETQNVTEKTESPVMTEKKTADITSPKKQYSLLQQSYQGSILNRGKGALARLAALATPLAADDDAPKGKSAAPSNRRNFVFATLTPEAPKVIKRKAEANPSTPKLVKKMKTEEKLTMSKSSLLDHMKV